VYLFLSVYKFNALHVVCTPQSREEPKLFAIFDSRLKDIIRVSGGAGWGIDDQMSCLYEDYEAMVAEPIIL
jgi:hypothetical protein